MVHNQSAFFKLEVQAFLICKCSREHFRKVSLDTSSVASKVNHQDGLDRWISEILPVEIGRRVLRIVRKGFREMSIFDISAIESIVCAKLSFGRRRERQDHLNVLIKTISAIAKPYLLPLPILRMKLLRSVNEPKPPLTVSSFNDQQLVIKTKAHK